jgi:hypothetical protein
MWDCTPSQKVYTFGFFFNFLLSRGLSTCWLVLEISQFVFLLCKRPRLSGITYIDNNSKARYTLITTE